MEIIELLLDEKSELAGIEAISIVKNGGIESDFIALKSEKIKLAEVDKERKILMGAALIPNKPIYRKQGDKEYYVFFSKETIKKASQLFFVNGNQNNATLEHQMSLSGLSVVESWLVEDTEMDKSKLYDLDLPVGTWAISMKVDNDEIWNEFVKTGMVNGFSIEGYFVDKADVKTKTEETKMSEEKANEKLEEIKKLFNQ